MQLFFDFLPALAFFATYVLSKNLYQATAVLIVGTIVQMAWQWWQHKRLEKTHWITLGVVLLFGGSTLLLKNPLFIKWKPTIVYWILGVVMLVSSYRQKSTDTHFLEGLFKGKISLPIVVWHRIALSWVAFFFLTGGLNLYVAYSYDEATWVNFKVFGLLVLTFIFAIGQVIVLAKYAKHENSH